ncbi:response regulator [Desulfonatronovibrio magnus]|uniref:response regulator n=1 Tax=Desulfonatronovibrio magnus TaxID=698827 RepID=UPI0005EAD921|nr:response regulator [Desulfonatronovibrio magnus]
MINKTILLVDDEPDFRFSMSLILKGHGFTTVEAGNGIEALEKLAVLEKQECPVDLIITDLRMPEMDGLELLKNLIEQKAKAKLLIITGYGERETIKKLTQMGLSTIINKPFSADILISNVKSLLSE